MPTPSLPPQLRVQRVGPRFFLVAAYCTMGLHLFTAAARFYFQAPAPLVHGEAALMLAGLLFVLSYQGEGWPFSMSVPFMFYAMCGLVASFFPAYCLPAGLAALLVQMVVFAVLQLRRRR